jgi:hypothetical protein
VNIRQEQTKARSSHYSHPKQYLKGTVIAINQMNKINATLSGRLSRHNILRKNSLQYIIKCFSTDHGEDKSQSSAVPGTTLKINWKLRDGSIVLSHAKVGDVLLRVAQSHGVELEGACEGVSYLTYLLPTLRIR